MEGRGEAGLDGGRSWFATDSQQSQPLGSQKLDGPSELLQDGRRGQAFMPHGSGTGCWLVLGGGGPEVRQFSSAEAIPKGGRW